MFEMLREVRFFSKLDLTSGFHHIRVKPEDMAKNPFNTKYDQFQNSVTPTFQSLIDRIFYDCLGDVFVVYMEDMMIFSKEEQSHLRHIELVLSCLKDHKLHESRKKCEFLKE